MNFISCSGASEIDNNITGSFQKVLRSTLNNCKHIIDNNKKGRFIHLNPNTPVIN